MMNNAALTANGNQNGNQTQNQVNVSGNTAVIFKIKNTNQVSQHNEPNEIVAVLLTLTTSLLSVITQSPPYKILYSPVS